MMGRSHAASGAFLWLAGAAVLERTGYHQPPVQIAVGTVVCAGAALLPDLDMSGGVLCGKGGATIARTFGRASLFVAECVEKLSLGVYCLTKTDADPDRDNGHRTLTHTLPFAAVAGAAVSGACALWGRWAVVAVLFLFLGLGVRGLLDEWCERAGWLPITILSLIAAVLVYLHLPAGRGYPLLGVAVAAGCVVHLLGDVITRAGIPVLWPFRYRRRRWHMIGVPNAVAVTVGGKVECLIRGLCVVGAFAGTVGLAFPDLVAHLAR